MIKRPVLALLAGLALSAALAGCGSFLRSAAGVGPDGPGAGSGAQASAKSLPYDVSRFLDPGSGKFLGVEAPGVAGSLAPVVKFAHSVGRRPNIIGQYVA